MRRAQLTSAYSDQMDGTEDAEREKQRDCIVDRETMKLQRKCDQLEKHRLQERLALDRSIGKLEDEIEFLKRENFEIELKFVELGSSGDLEVQKQQRGTAANEEREAMGSEMCPVANQIERETKILKELNLEIEKVKVDLTTVNRKLNSLPSSSSPLIPSKSQSTAPQADENTNPPLPPSVSSNSVETTLHLAKTHCSKLSNENASLRTRIKALRDEFRILSDELQKHDAALAAKQRTYAALCHETSQMQEDRQESVGRIRALGERGRKIMASLGNEERSLQRAIANEIKLREYLVGKFADRRASYGETERKGDEEKELAGENGNDEEDGGKLDSSLTARKRELNDYDLFMEKIANRESMRLVKGKDRLPTLIDRHAVKEQINFSRFNQINRLSSEIEKMQHSVESLCLENEEMDEDMTWNRTRVNEELRMMESEINRMDSSIAVNDERCTQDQQLLQQTTEAMHSLCKAFGVDFASLERVLGENESKTFSVLAGQLEKQLTRAIRVIRQDKGMHSIDKTHPSSNFGGNNTLKRNLSSAKSKQQANSSNFRSNTVYTGDSGGGVGGKVKSTDLTIPSKINNNHHQGVEAGGAMMAQRPETSQIYERLQNMKDSVDVDFNLPKFPLTRCEIRKMIAEQACETAAAIESQSQMLVPSNHSLEINSI